MKQLIAGGVLFALAAVANAYSINHSYSGQKNSTEYYGACDNGQLIKVIEHSDGHFSYEGPAGRGEFRGDGTLDKAAAAACGE